ncbi:hypothetical protein [Actinomadura flavalba]|uniref:hypothetical protein n=1 Tax=Actinomadura flavalba TaxID=1120938 RepID=UPI0012DE983B|nr:hypothetical protein [Actinomadura flavalba]
MADDWVDVAVADLGRWARENNAGVDEPGARLLLELARDELGLRGRDALDAAALRALLLEVFPETVVADADEVPAVLATVRALVSFLAATGAAHADALDAELTALEPEFTDAVAETAAAERDDAAQVIAGLMAADGVDAADTAAAERWMAAFEALPEEERYARVDAYLRDAEDLRVPPVRLAPLAELAAAARASGLTRQVAALAEWADGRSLTADDEPDADDALAAVEAVALPTPRRAPTVADLADLPELARLWWAAVDAEMITVADRRAAPGPALAALTAADDETARSAWLDVFEAAAVPEHDDADGLDAIELVQNELTGVLLHLYEQPAPVTADDLAGALTAHVTADYDVADPRALGRAVTDALAAELDDLDAWGVVARAGATVTLTPLGVWAVRELLLTDGYDAPAVGDLAGVSAADLVSGLAGYPEDAFAAEADGWLAGRAVDAAARDLLAVMRGGSPGDRAVGGAVLLRAGDAAEPAVRDAAGTPAVKAFAAGWLTAHGREAFTLTPQEEDWAFVDGLAGTLEIAGPEATGDALAALGTALPEAVWRCDHPETAAVLTALGAHAPDRAVAKAARTAAHKARSRRPAS